MFWRLFIISNNLMSRGRPRLSRWLRNVVSLFVRVRYEWQIRRLRHAVKHRRLRVLFVIGDDSKWKAQSVYEELVRSHWADPYAVPTKMDIGWIPDGVQDSRVARCRSYLEGHHVRCVDGCANDGSLIPLKRHCPDIVIYQQPWGMDRCQHPIEVSRYALTFYLPYCIPAYVDLRDNFMAPFYRMIYGYFLQNGALAKYYSENLSRPYFGCQMFPVGTPYCDALGDSALVTVTGNGGYVIYAPHWDCNFDGKGTVGRNGTFPETGKLMLGFAQEHPDVHWVFKPHPMLRVKLVQSGYMSEKEVDAYYRDWEKIGLACYDSDYFKLFRNSRVMITDSISFLTEYLYVNKPLIHLVNKIDIKFPPPTQWMMEAYTRVNEEDDLLNSLNEIVLRGQDTLAEVRTRINHEICGQKDSATQNVVRCLEKICHIN